MTRIALAASAALFALAPSLALAGPAGDMTKARIEAVAAGKLEALAADYAPNATLYWVGGPLNGVYTGGEALSGVWTKFAKAQGPLTVAMGEVKEAANPAGATVTADVVFTGKAAIPVRYVMTWMGGKLVAETWQINPPAK